MATVKRDALLSALLAAKEVDQQVGLFVDAENLCLKAAKRDLCVSIRIPCNGGYKRTKALILNVSGLPAFLKNYKKDEVEFSIEEGNFVKFDEFEMSGKDENEYPIFADECLGRLAAEISMKGLEKALRETYFPFYDKKSANWKYLSGGWLELEAEKGILVIGTDAKRIAFRRLEGKVFENFKLIIPWQTLTILRMLMKGKEDGLLRVFVLTAGTDDKDASPIKIWFDWPGGTLESYLVSAVYPDWRKIVPTYDGCKIWKVKRVELMNAFKCIKASIPLKEEDLTVSFRFSDGVLSLVAKSYGMIRLTLPVVDGKDSGEFRLRSKFVLGYLKSLPRQDEFVEIRFVDNDKPVGWFRVGSKDPDYVLAQVSPDQIHRRKS